MAVKMGRPALVRTKLKRPELPGDQIPWRWLLDRLHDGSPPNVSDEANQRQIHC